MVVYMSDSPIIRLAAWLWASTCNLPDSDQMFQDELTYFYKEHRSCKLPNWTVSWIEKAQRAHEYIREED